MATQGVWSFCIIPDPPEIQAPELKEIRTVGRRTQSYEEKSTCMGDSKGNDAF